MMQSLPMPLKQAWMRWALPIALGLVAAFLTFVCRDFLGHMPFSFFFPAVLLSAFLGGLGAGLLGMGLAISFVQVVLGHPGGFSLFDRADAIALAVFTFFGVLSSLLCGALHRSWGDAEKGLAAARASSKRLREGRRNLARIFRQTTVGIAETYFDGRIRLANPSFCEMIGYTTKELHDRSLYDLLHPDDCHDAAAQTQELATGRSDRYTSQQRFLRKDGSIVWAEMTRSVVRGEGGRAEYVLSIVHNLTPQKQMEVAARVSEERFRTLFATAPMGICITRQGMVLYFNDACMSMFGHDVEAEMRGRSFLDLLAPECRDEFAQRGILCEQGEPVIGEHETIGLRRSGRRFPFHIVVSRLETEEGPATVGFITDVSRQRAAEHTAHENAERLQVAISAADMGTWRLNPTTRELSRGQSLNRILGLEQVPSQQPLEDFLACVHPGDRDEVTRSIDRSLVTGQPHEAEFRLVRPDGTVRWVRNRGKLITAAGETPAYMTGALVDVTELRQAQQTLQERERELQAIVGNVPSIIGRHDLDLRCLFINVAVEAATGHPPSDFIGRTVDEMPVPLELRDQVRARMMQVIETGEPATFDFALASPLQQRYFQCRVVPERGTSGQLAYLLTLTHDITDLKAAEAELSRSVGEEQTARRQAEAASRAKDQFLAVLSHELRTPLTPVMMTVAAMEMDPGLDERVREDLAMVRRNVELETKLIDDLLDVTRIVNGKLRLQPARTALHPLIHLALRILQADIDRKQLRIELDLGAADDVVNGDAARLQQVLWNLVKNAVKFSFDGGRIQIRTDNQPEHSFRIEVIDQGMGIEPEAKRRLFVAFEQGSASVTRQFGGLGLGLAISKAIIDLHGGTIEAASDGHGRGARFSVRLPTMAAVERLVDRIQPPEVPLRADGLRVLLVEDHVDTVRMLERYLGGVGYQVASAGSVAAALTLASERQFDVIISDIGLPDASGLDLMRQIRQRSGVRGIAISGFGMDSDIRASQEAGFEVHLTKPIDPQSLHATIHKVVGQVAKAGQAVSE